MKLYVDFYDDAKKMKELIGRTRVDENSMESLALKKGDESQNLGRLCTFMP